MSAKKARDHSKLADQQTQAEGRSTTLHSLVTGCSSCVELATANGDASGQAAAVAVLTRTSCVVMLSVTAPCATVAAHSSATLCVP